ncbi:LacI family DNA-binding transcriptional regulator [Brooklawnia cerclae]|uniref:LacI family transcriptional regulator n=1 Tax=Brooklawnia cerclae TaxID=349934 RepID=A0ABX0SHY2_9ACTN|nr:LacI family DNA-binding transcriptional regulator [Brooklawnia cerclae]NIH58002.1 LacI family transcriptional regulator [Brooklawnia cerclae]
MASEQARRVTLRDVADAAGVSLSTASRVLDDRGRASHTPTAQRVRETADQLGYRRNAMAAGLRRGETSTIGVLVPRLTDTVMAAMFEAIERTARQRGQFAVVAISGDDPEQEHAATQRLLDRDVDGVILATARVDDTLPASLRERAIAHVLVLRTDGVSASVLGDDDYGGYAAVRHLVDLGHRRIGLVFGPKFTSTANDRLAGAKRALDEAGIDIDPRLVVFGGYGIDSGVSGGEALLALDAASRPTAIFAANDNLAVGVMSAGYRAGLTPGRDFSLVGYNDIPLAQRLPVPLTSVRVPFDQIAATALDVLSGRREQGIHRILPSLIPRASSAHTTD